MPGQAMYSATRRLVLKGADSLVFVANSALDRWEENLQSYREMTQNLALHHLDPTQMPLVLQYNKRDLPQVLEIEALDRALNSATPTSIPAVAVRGEGVLETFGPILARTVQDLANRYAILDVKEGAPARQWAEQAARGALRADPPPADPQGSPATRPMPRVEPAPPSGPPDSRPRIGSSASDRLAGLHRGAGGPGVAPPEEAQRAAGPTRGPSELVETYAEASAQLGAALTELREERDVARQRLDDLRQTMEAAQELLAAATPLETALEPVLARMARIAGVDARRVLGAAARAAAARGRAPGARRAIPCSPPRRRCAT